MYFYNLFEVKITSVAHRKDRQAYSLVGHEYSELPLMRANSYICIADSSKTGDQSKNAATYFGKRNLI